MDYGLLFIIIIIITVGPPSQPLVRVDSTTATSISLSWSVTNGSVVSYDITWSSEKCAEDEGNATITDGSTHYKLVSLIGSTSYVITVTAVNQFFRIESKLLNATTDESGKRFN